MVLIENPSQEKIREILLAAKVIAVVGLSPKEDRPSNEIARFLIKHGYKVVPVNPAFNEILGQKSYPTVAAIPDHVDIVDIFRRPEEVGPIIKDAIAKGAKVVWMQLGIRNDLEAQKVLDAGSIVVQDKCILKEHKALLGDS